MSVDNFFFFSFFAYPSMFPYMDIVYAKLTVLFRKARIGKKMLPQPIPKRVPFDWCPFWSSACRPQKDRDKTYNVFRNIKYRKRHRPCRGNRLFRCRLVLASRGFALRRISFIFWRINQPPTPFYIMQILFNFSSKKISLFFFSIICL